MQSVLGGSVSVRKNSSEPSHSLLTLRTVFVERVFFVGERVVIGLKYVASKYSSHGLNF